ncbi:hypothetical protein ES703_117281 [subsurface metagenome]
MSGTCNYIRALLERLLEVRAHKTQYMSHVIHDEGIQGDLLYKPAYLRHRLGMDNHTFTQDNELRSITLEKLFYPPLMIWLFITERILRCSCLLSPRFR